VVGEDIAQKYLEKRGYRTIARNYRKKWGELDIVMEKDGVVHVIEVKTVSLSKDKWPKEGEDAHRPEDKVHAQKRARLARAIQTFLAEKHLFEREWTCDVVTVCLDPFSKTARVQVLADILL
jgi:putative endonuclease